ncbi:MAG: LysM peptidoglycan-binding domain-containing protein [Acidobacteriaceae bacterium]|nr:LysM peptidoglycan-binding domain-containing protein [Acidobacteriaceae bacterium]
MDRLEELKNKYANVLTEVKKQNVSLSHLHVQDNKLFMQGAAPNEDAKNAVWNAIKAVDPSYSDLTCDLTIDSSLPAPAAASSAQSGRKYTVKAGDTLSKISQEFYGNANQYMKIAQANGIENPNLIKVGQELEIPA